MVLAALAGFVGGVVAVEGFRGALKWFKAKAAKARRKYSEFVD